MTLRILEAIAEHPEPLVLCTVLRVKGSAPRHAGSKMLVGPQGRLLGSVGGGRGEAMALAASAEQSRSGRAAVLEIEMQGAAAEGPDMLCGGSSRILVEPLLDRGPYLAALARLRRGEPALLCKRLADGASALLDGLGEPVHGNLAEADPELSGRALTSATLVLAESSGLLYDPLMPDEKLLILGAGHVGQALAALAPGLGFQVTVADDRPEFMAEGRFPAGVATLAGPFAELVAAFPFDAATFAVVVSRSHLTDLECVRAVLARTYRYAGFMGSRRKTQLVLEQVAADGFDPAKVEALRAPIGFELGAETPAELAVAIAAELIAARHRSPSLVAVHADRKARRLTS